MKGDATVERALLARPKAVGTVERCLASAFAKPTARQVRGRGARQHKRSGSPLTGRARVPARCESVLEANGVFIVLD